tara:strand:+ start:57 stop:233 length:177 start_codon:yes stop_codon:yes gene_type:complete
MSSKIQKTFEKGLLLSKNIETRIETILQNGYEEMSNVEKISLSAIVKRRYRMCGRCDA